MASFYSFCVCAGTATSLRCKRQRVTAKRCSGSLLIILKEHDAIYLDFVSGGAAIKGLVAADLFGTYVVCPDWRAERAMRAFPG